eukprot:scaffold412_cov311-Pavlova_lutheri.AAC.2
MVVCAESNHLHDRWYEVASTTITTQFSTVDAGASLFLLDERAPDGRRSGVVTPHCFASHCLHGEPCVAPCGRSWWVFLSQRRVATVSSLPPPL